MKVEMMNTNIDLIVGTATEGGSQRKNEISQ
jgi:hypothetical protein